jgi:hypothetical protein
MTLLVVALLAIAVFGVFVVCAYWQGWQWTGMPARRSSGNAAERPAKTLWDWLQLLGIPVALAALAFMLNDAQTRRDERREDQRAVQQRVIAADAERESTLRTYLAQMSDFILTSRLRSKPRADVRNVGRTATLIALRRLDGPRRGLVVRFLAEAGLLRTKEHASVPVRLETAELRDAQLKDADLSGADLSATILRDANLRNTLLIPSRIEDLRLAYDDKPLPAQGLSSRADLSHADLRRANFSGANLWAADLTDANLGEASLRETDLSATSLSGANLRGADLRGADLSRADLSYADLSGADLTDADLSNSNLSGAHLSNTTISGADLHGARDAHLAGAHGTSAHGP